MKTPKEVKRGLECCSDYERQLCGNTQCPYRNVFDCVDTLLRDALALINRLDKDVVETEKKATAFYNQRDKLESKLNQAVEDFHMLGRTGEFICPVCAYYNHGEGTTGKCVKCLTGDGFRWRGEKEEEHAESDRGCSTCANDGMDMPQCRECTEHPGYPWYKLKDGGAEA